MRGPAVVRLPRRHDASNFPSWGVGFISPAADPSQISPRPCCPPCNGALPVAFGKVFPLCDAASRGGDRKAPTPHFTSGVA